MPCPTVEGDTGSEKRGAKLFPSNPAKDLYEINKSFVSTPLKFRLSDSEWLVPFGVVMAGFFAADDSIERELPTSKSLISRSNSFSNYGAVALGGVVAGSYLVGSFKDDSYLRDTGWMAGEAALESVGVDELLKTAFGRQRPNEGTGSGGFFQGGASFPSLHTTAAWSVATVLASRYPGPLTKLLSYGGASAISAARLTGRNHFASDVFIGAALGWYIGHQIVRREDLKDAGEQNWGTFVRDNTEGPHRGTGSPEVPIDSWIYTAIDRLQSLGVTHTAYLGMRPWTRSECARLVLEAVDSAGEHDGGSDSVTETIDALRKEFAVENGDTEQRPNLVFDSLYQRAGAISGRPLTDGWHTAQTLIDDYGRPYQEGFNSITGVSVRANAGPFAFSVRGEYQHAPSTAALPQYVREAYAFGDSLPYVTNQLPVAPGLPTPAINRFRLLESTVSFSLGDWQTSFGKQSLWWGQSYGGDLMFSNNAEPVYMLRLTKTHPLRLPGILGWLGPIRTDNFLGQLQGQRFVRLTNKFILNGSYDQTLSPQPFLYGSKFSLMPTANLEIGVGLTTVLGGQGRPLTFGNFAHTFSFTGSAQNSDPGDRRTSFEFRYRVPKLRKWLTLYANSMSEDQPSPIAYPRQSAMNPGVYIPQLPKLGRLELRVEGVYTDLPGQVYSAGYYYYNAHYTDGYRNYGQIIGDWVGRQGVGVQAWTKYKFRNLNDVELSYRHQTVDKAFIEGGNLSDFSVKSNWMIRPNLQATAFFQYEYWRFPVLASERRSNISSWIQFTFRPRWSLR